MATVSPGGASTALSFPHTSGPIYTVDCPFCQSATPYESNGEGNCIQIPCGSCGNNLILLPQAVDQAPVKHPAPPPTEPAEPAMSPDIPFAQRRLGVLVAILAGLLNYLMIASLAGAVLTQAQETHDPYDVDEALLSPSSCAPTAGLRCISRRLAATLKPPARCWPTAWRSMPSTAGDAPHCMRLPNEAMSRS